MARTRANKRKLIRKRHKKVGAPPGTLVHVGEGGSSRTCMTRIDYDQRRLEEQQLTDVRQCHRPESHSGVAWYNIDGVRDTETVRHMGEAFGLHRLIMEDIVNTDHRPKVEVHDDYIYIVVKMLLFDDSNAQMRIEQVSLVFGPGFVLSFQEQPGDVFDGVRQRLRSGRRIRQMGPDYLAYALLDAIVDNYFVILEKFGDQVEKLEEELMGAPGPDTLARIHHFKREMLLLRKAVWPLREVLNNLTRGDTELINPETRIYLRDVHDHTIHIMDNIETLRDLLAGMLDLYISNVSNRMNEIMKVLTLFATIFMPLTFIAGIYGMNFENMPELSWPWAYPVTLSAMLALGLGLAAFFKWKKWL